MTKYTTINQMPEEDRPYEKCLRLGAECLTDSELLAVLLRTGTKGSPSVEMAEEVLKLSKDREGLLGLHHLSLAQLQAVKGIGKVKAIQLNVLENFPNELPPQLQKKGFLFNILPVLQIIIWNSFAMKKQELLICTMLDTKNHLLGDEMIFKGTVNSSLANPREIFLSAVSYHAVGILLVHNHPSGDCTPSQADVDFTQRVKEAGELLGIPLLDHIIIGDCKYLSFREQGIF